MEFRNRFILTSLQIVCLSKTTLVLWVSECIFNKEFKLFEVSCNEEKKEKKNAKLPTIN